MIRKRKLQKNTDIETTRDAIDTEEALMTEEELEAENEKEEKSKEYIIGAYIFSMLLWIFLAHLLGIAPWTAAAKATSLGGIVGWTVFFAPLIVLGIGIFSVWKSSHPCLLYNATTSGNILYLGILIAIPLFTLLDSNYKGDRTQFSLIILASITVAIISQVDIWGTKKWSCFIRHIASSLKTISIGLLLSAIALYALNGKYVSPIRDVP